MSLFYQAERFLIGPMPNRSGTGRKRNKRMRRARASWRTSKNRIELVSSTLESVLRIKHPSSLLLSFLTSL